MAKKTLSKKTTGKKATRKKAAARKTAGKRTVAGAARKTAARRKAPVIELASECGIRDVAGLHETLVGAVGESTTVTLDACRVDRVDASVLQVLGAFVRDRQAAGLTVAWRDSPSEAFLRAARLIDLDRTLGLDGTA